jgi:hypothetical protein
VVKSPLSMVEKMHRRPNQIRGQVLQKGRFKMANRISRIQCSKMMIKIEQNSFSNDAYKRMCINLYDKKRILLRVLLPIL